MCDVIRTILERDLAGVIRRKMEEVYSPQQIGLGAKQKERVEKENRNAFIVSLRKKLGHKSLRLTVSDSTQRHGHILQPHGDPDQERVVIAAGLSKLHG